jgi:methanogenic corrinoid protein MtbC1/DNA-binding transcriptional MerR regulator
VKKTEILLDIASVERETGIGKDALRVWEKRYGFPVPVRDDRDDRLYPQIQVDQLRAIKRLLDKGLRISNVVGLKLSELNDLLVPKAPAETHPAPEIALLLGLIKQHQATSLRIALSRALLRQGLNAFLSKTIIPLNYAVGECWMRGEMRIFEEHLYSEQITSVLQATVASIRDPNGSPRILLTTLPGEEHSLGLLMVEALLSLHGAHCVMLGVQTPIQEIVSAAEAHKSDIVVLSFSEAMPVQQMKSGLQQARNALPQEIQLWVGGAGVARYRNSIDGVKIMGPFSDLIEALKVMQKNI